MYHHRMEAACVDYIKTFSLVGAQSIFTHYFREQVIVMKCVNLRSYPNEI